MDLLVLDTNLQAVGVIDTFESIIWTDRYSKCGDFEILTQVTMDSLNMLQEDYYLWLSESNHVMIIESLTITTDAEEGNKLLVKGRSLESILDRRIVWVQTLLSGSFQTAIQKLLNENIISATDTNRRVSNFIFEASTDPVITTLQISAQFTGDNLYDAIQRSCDANNIGFRVTLTDANQFKFKLYAGSDRSYSQSLNPYVVFSPKFDNIISSNYIESKRNLKTVTLVAGEGEGIDRRTISVGNGASLARREHFTDARDISSAVTGGTLTPTEYNAQLTQRGLIDLAERIYIQSFEGQIETTQTYKYGEDFFMGDIVQIVNEYGMEARTRVVELIHSQNLSGTETYPTFATV